MTTDHFNSLPIEARSFITKNAGCLGCGNSEAKLDRAYKLYLNTKKMNAYTLFGGGVNFVTAAGEKGVLYNIQPNDEPFAIREKIRIARLVRAASPHVFSAFSEEEIENVLAELPKEEVVLLGTEEFNVDTEEFNVDTADYNALRSYVKDNGIETEGNSKKDLIAAIKAADLL